MNHYHKLHTKVRDSSFVSSWRIHVQRPVSNTSTASNLRPANTTPPTFNKVPRRGPAYTPAAVIICVTLALQNYLL